MHEMDTRWTSEQNELNRILMATMYKGPLWLSDLIEDTSSLAEIDSKPRTTFAWQAGNNIGTY